MALSIATNVAALQSSASASSVNRDLETSMARLSTGKRINSASDDAAGVAIASRLTAEIRGTDQAIRNALDGQAMIDTAEGGHSEIEAILQRMREVSVQAANDTNNAQDRGNLQAEMNALKTEIDRIAGVTTWAGNSVMSGTGAANSTKTFNLQVGAATGAKNQIAVAIGSMDTATLLVGKTSTISDVVYTTSSAVGTDSAKAFKASAADTKTEVTIEGVKFTANASGGTATLGVTATELANAINADS